MMSKFLAVTVLALGSFYTLARPDSYAALPTYKPAKVTVPRDARYVLPNGGIRLYGSATLQPLVRELNVLFVKTHPGFKFDTGRMKGPSSAIAALTYDVTAFAALDRPLNSSELASYVREMGEPPLAIRAATGKDESGEENIVIFYVRVLPGEPVAPFVKEYLRMVLSQEGQAIIAASSPQYKVLTGPVAATELAKLNRPN